MAEASRIGVLLIQENHGFSRGQAVAFDGEDWVVAETGDEGVGLVGSLVDANTFEFVTHGELDGLDGLTPGAAYYIVDGELSTTAEGLSVGFALSETSLFVQTVSVGTTTGSGGGDDDDDDDFDHSILVTDTQLEAAFASRDVNTDSPITGGDDLSGDITLGFDQTVDLDNNARVSVALNGVAVGERRQINIIDSATIETTVVDDDTNEEVEVTIGIPLNAVTNAELAQMPALTMKGNDTNSAADPQDLTPDEVREFIGLTLGKVIAAANFFHYR